MSAHGGRLYLVVDDALPRGLGWAQVAHVTAEIFAARPAECAAWRAASNTVVVLGVPAERLARLAARPGATSFREPDLGGELTAVAILDPDPATTRLLRRERLAS